MFGVTRPPLREIAALASVSEPTVSRVLNGRPGVAEATRKRVVDALREQGYHEVPEPRAVRRNVIGVVCGEFLNPVFPTFVHHISTALAKRGYLTNVVVTDPDLCTEDRCVRELVASGVDGAIFIGGHHAEVDGDLSVYAEAAEADVPIVLVNGTATSLHVPHVFCDEEAGAFAAVSHLVGLGHTRIGCLLGSSIYIPTSRMIAGYRHALSDNDITEPDGAILDVAFTLEGGKSGASRLIQNGFTALIAGNDLMALGALRAADDRGRGRSDLSVVGYDGTDWTSITSAELTTLRQPFIDMAQHIATAIISEVAGEHRFRGHYVFEPELIVRGSTQPLRAAITAS